MSSSRARKNFRRRPEEDDAAANGDEPTNTTITTTITTTTTTTESPKLLSFNNGDEEDDESPLSRPPSGSNREKKKSSSRRSKSSLCSSSSSHKIISNKDRVSSSSSSTATTSSSSSPLLSNVQPQAGQYTMEKLRELQKNTRTLASASSRPPPSPTPPPPRSEPILVLKGLIKPMSGNEENGIGGEELDEDDDGEELLNDGRRGVSFRKDKDDAENRLASMGIGKTRDSSVPDQATIDKIKAERERLRQSRAAAPDFISLDGGSNHGEAEGLSDEEPEFRTRIALLGDTTDGVKKGVFESVDVKGIGPELRRDGELEEVDDEEEEEKIWEEEQFRKGLGKRMDDNSNRGVSKSVPVVNHHVQHQSYGYPGTEYQQLSIAPTIGGDVGVSRSVEVMSISQQAEVATQALQNSIRRLKESHGRTVSAVNRTDENLSASLSNITDLEHSLSVTHEKHLYMQKLRHFVSVISDFLQHKALYIEVLEEQMQELHKDRASAIVKRRMADSADEMPEVEAAVNAAMMVFNKGGNSAAMVSAAATAGQAALAATREQSNLSVKLDEHGRDENLQKHMDMKRRADARERRKARSESKRMSSIRDDTAFQFIEGESSTDESDSESTSYRSHRQLLLQTAEKIFSDANEEYSQLSVVKEQLETWKKLYSSSYNDAYMSISAPAIFSPYVRLELLKWDPLYEEADFNNMNWYSLLFNYGLPEHGGDFKKGDADAYLVPELVEKVALPKLHHEITQCWDMLSTRETQNAVSATNLVITYIETESKALRELLSAIHKRLADAVANLIVPTWNTHIIKAVPNAARVAAYRFGMSIRLLRNICLWKDILAAPILEQLALDDLLSGKVLPHVRSITPNIHDAVTRTERILASLSGVWSGPGVTGERSRKLQPLVDCVLTLGKTLEKKHAAGVSESETNTLARRLKKMLVELNEYDKARAIARTFQLKEAL